MAPPLLWLWLVVSPLLLVFLAEPLLVVLRPPPLFPRRQDSMSSVWVRERIGRSPYTVVAALALMMAPPHCGGSSCGASAGLSMEASGKSGGAGCIIDWPSEYSIDVRLGDTGIVRRRSLRGARRRRKVF